MFLCVFLKLHGDLYILTLPPRRELQRALTQKVTNSSTWKFHNELGKSPILQPPCRPLRLGSAEYVLFWLGP